MSRSPDEVLSDTDPGDDVQLRFRYQHAYGVILICLSAAEKKQYEAIWCEHHEDLLGEKSNGRFDSYQVKTGTPEHGYWETTDPDFKKSIKRFVALDRSFPGKFDAHSFVSNVKFFDTTQEAKISKSPIRLLEAVRTAATLTVLDAPYHAAITDLATDCDCTPAELFDCLKRVKLVEGPGKDDFDAVLAHQHVGQLSECRALASTELSGLRDEMMQVVFRASSLAIDSPEQHVRCVLGTDRADPQLLAKRLVPRQVLRDALEGRRLVFRFAPTVASLSLKPGRSDLRVLQAKLIRAGLGAYFETMSARTLSAELHLLELVAQEPESARDRINQLRQVVAAACADAEALASEHEVPWGLQMYRELLRRLDGIQQAHPELVDREPNDCLLGIAGLLTEACKVWWGPSFEIEEAE